MDPGVGSPGHDDRARDGGTGRLLCQRVLDQPLNGAQARLPGPAGEIRPVVADVQTQTNEPALPEGSGGLVRRISSRQDSSLAASASSSSDLRCDGGNWKPAASAASALANQTSATVRS